MIKCIFTPKHLLIIIVITFLLKNVINCLHRPLCNLDQLILIDIVNNILKMSLGKSFSTLKCSELSDCLMHDGYSKEKLGSYMDQMKLYCFNCYKGNPKY